jgi:hypothetical protein
MAARYRREFRLWGSTPDRDADDELRFHLEMRAAELVESGMPEEQARAQAARAFGDLAGIRRQVRQIDRQTERHMRLTHWLVDLRQDIASAVRQFRKAPGFTAAAIVTIALGIGATTAIFGVVHAVVLRPLPFPEPERLVLAEEWTRGRPNDVSAGNFVDWRAATADVFSHLAAVSYVNVNIAGSQEPERVLAGLVSRGFFEMFGMAPLHGRVLRPEEDRPGRDAVVVLSHALFVGRFGADARVVGQAIRLNDRPHVVVGVMPEAFDYLADNGDLWAPIAFTPEREAMHDEHYLTVFGRLAPGVTIAHANQRLVAVAAEVEKRFPRDNEGVSARVVSYTDWLVQDVRQRLFIWLGAVACVLLIACANVANLLLARGTGRARELAVRATLGASRWRIVRQLLAESLVLAAAGAAGGVLLAWWATQLLAASGPASLPRLFQAQVDAVVLAFAVGLTGASAVVFGLVPALRAPIRDSVHAVDPALPVHGLATMHERLSRSLASNTFNTRLIAVLGLMALTLAAIGIYSVIAYFVSQRRQDIGVRLALGATPADVVRLVVRQALAPVGLGLAAGVAGALAGARLLESQLGQVSPADPLAFAAAIAILAVVALLASALPARRAARVEPRLLVDG